MGDERQTEEPVGDAGVVDVESDGVLLDARVHVQCKDCTEVLEAILIPADLERVLTDPDVVEDFDVPCPTCSRKNGRPTFVLVAVLVGAQVNRLLDEPEEEPAIAVEPAGPAGAP